VSNPLDLKRTLAAIDRLCAGASGVAARVEQLERSLQQGRARAGRQLEADLAGLQERIDAAEAESAAGFHAKRKRTENRASLRRSRLSEARQRLREKLFRDVANDESREVFRIQRDLLQTSRDHEAGKARIDDAFEAMQASLAEERKAVETFHHASFESFLAYPSFRQGLNAEASPAELPVGGDEAQLLHQTQALRAQGEKALGRFRSSPIAASFRVFPIWLVLGLELALAGFGVPLSRAAGMTTVTWPLALGSLGAALALTLALYFLGKRSTAPLAREIASALGRAYLFLDTAGRLAAERHQKEQERMASEAATRSQALQSRWQQVVGEAEARRAQGERNLDARLARVIEHHARHHRNTLARLEAAHEADLRRIRSSMDDQRAAAAGARAGRLAEVEEKAESQFVELEQQWRQTLLPAYSELSASAQSTEAAFRPWTSPVWDAWSPPTHMESSVPFGWLDLDLEPVAGALLQHPRFALPGPARFPLPLVLSFPGQGSIVFETKDSGREDVLGALNNLVLRLLAGAPAGRARFTVLDPVGLGQSFAGLMHLTDHEDRLVNRRIWTQQDHIEQRLGELNDHVEKVTQLYLRNEYASIAEYNEQAGRIAEPYQFLVVADFPSNFSDLAIRRLLSLASSGPRCGIFLLIHRDERKATSADFVADDLRQASAVVRYEGGRFVLAGCPLPGARVTLEPPPDPERATAFLQRVGRSSIESNRVEVPFEQIAPADSEVWGLDALAELRVPIGRTGATKLQHFAVGKGTRQHALIAGKTGSGKSTLFHVLVTNLSLWCSPDQVEFYLVDFKKGVEFKCYATHRLPHARVVAIESDREFGLSVLQRIDAELHRRGDLFREVGAQDLPGYKRAGGTAVLPRSLLIIDEFQEFFTEDDRIAQSAALLLDRLVRQGRAFGIHVLLGSQTLGGAYTLARSTLGQMVVRIALQCNEADALLIMDDDNPAPRLLSRPGEAIYNDAAGAIEGNSPFQIVWLPDEERDVWLEKVSAIAARSGSAVASPVVFEGNTPAEIRENPILERLLSGTEPANEARRFWLGAPNAIKGPTEIALHRQSGNHVLILGQHDESSLALLGTACLALAAQHARNGARFLILDATPPGHPHRDFLERVARALPQTCTFLTPHTLTAELESLVADIEARGASAQPEQAPAVYLIIHHLERFKSLRYEEDFGISLGGETRAQPGPLFNRILSEGSHLGIHVLCLCDTYNNVTRFLSRRALAEFELRVLFQMNANDSASLIDTPKASLLGLYRALLHSARDGTLETFRPYALPDAAWVEEVGRRLGTVVQ
jgi:ABC-type multidrug transport system fused ATPase/permease subunit